MKIGNHPHRGWCFVIALSVFIPLATPLARADDHLLPVLENLIASRIPDTAIVVLEDDAVTVRRGEAVDRITASSLDGRQRAMLASVVSTVKAMARAAAVEPALPMTLRVIRGKVPDVPGNRLQGVRVYAIPAAAAPLLDGSATSAAIPVVLNTATSDEQGSFTLLLPANVPYTLLIQIRTASATPPILEWQMRSDEITVSPVTFSEEHRRPPKTYTIGPAIAATATHATGQGGSPPVVATPASAPSSSQAPMTGANPIYELVKKKYDVVTVFYATDRKYHSGLLRKGGYSGERGTMSFGTCDVSIPATHRTGELETRSRWTLSRVDKPDEYVVLLGLRREQPEAFFENLKNRINTSPGRKALIFVHGYNVTFEDAARRTAQMAYDLEFKGAPIFFSWPSQGRVDKYPTDEANIEWSEPNLRLFLSDCLQKADAQEVYIIAHSMGTRALTKALASLFDQMPLSRTVFRGIVLAAPDIDADVFKRDIAPRLAASPDNPDDRIVTLYVSNADLALKASKKFHTYPRAGDSSGTVPYVVGIETIEASSVDTNLFSLGHSTAMSSRTILSDIHSVVMQHARASRRYGLKKIELPSGAYWEFKK